MSYKKTKKPSREDLKNMFKSKDINSICLDLNVSLRTVQRWKENYKLSDEEIIIGNNKLNSFQLEIITGIMLGNGCINDSKFTYKNDYNKFIEDKLKPYNNVKCKEFNDLYHIWYKEDRKIIPNIILNKNILFFWFIDSGNIEKSKVVLSCDDFNILYLMKRDLNLIGKIDGKKIKFESPEINEIIEERFNFFKLNKSIDEEIEICKKRENNVPIDEILKDHQISRSTMYRIVKKHSETYPSGKKLTKSDVLEIISLWNDGMFQVDIANKFDVSQTMISQIIKRKTRKDITKSIYIRNKNKKSSATVSTIYNPKN